VGAAVLVASGLTIIGVTVPAMAGGSITVNPSSNLSGGQSVTVTGSGFTASSPGTVLECNNAPNEPNVNLGAPISSAVSVGCTAPSFSHIVSTGADGSLSTTYTIVSGTVGPPCGPSPDIVTCPSTDTAGMSPATDAANYSCPPTPAQQAAGVICQLNYGDSAGDGASANILFSGESPPPSTTTTSGGGPTTTSGGGPTTTPPTTTPTPVTTRPTATAPTGSGGGSGSAPATASSSGTLAQTGPGPTLWAVLALGIFLALVGVVVWFAPPWSRLRRLLRGSSGRSQGG
jgi:hypothetical protein